MVYYASTIFQALGFQSGEKATLASLGIGIAKLVATIISLSTVDKGGRRRFLLIGVSVMAVSILTLGIISHYSPLDLHPTRKCHFVTQTRNFTEPASNQTHMANKGLRYLTLSALVLFVGAYSFSFGPVSWLVLSEIFPAGIKGRAFSITTVINWGTNLFVSLTFLDMLSGIGTSSTFIFYAVVCILALLFVYKYVPETKGRTLEQISAELNARKPREILPRKLTCCKGGGRRRLRELGTRPSPTGSATDMLLENSC